MNNYFFNSDLTRLLTLFIILLCCAHPSVSAKEQPPLKQLITWNVWSSDIFKQARLENKLILIDLTAEWCQWCKKMEHITYQDPKIVQMLHSNFITVRVDQDKNPIFASRYKLFGPPATIIYNARGTEIIKRKGYLQPQWLLWMLEAVVDNPAPEAHL